MEPSAGDEDRSVHGDYRPVADTRGQALRDTDRLEPRLQADKRPMLDDVVLIAACARALVEVNGERAVAQDAGISDARVCTDLPAVGGEHVPREGAASIEAADIA